MKRNRSLGYAAGLLTVSLVLWFAVSVFGAEDSKGADLFFSDEINRMIDENFAEVTEEGFAELRIPMELHHISTDSFSPNCVDASQKLMDAGFDVYLVGGALRDMIMGLEGNDFDITTNASYKEVEQVLGNITYHYTQDGFQFAFASYPGEIIDVSHYLNIPAAYYGMEGIPDFEPGSLYSDSLLFDSFERDMPMNAIYYDMKSGDIVDFHGGLYSIREQILDTMVDPDLQYRSDPPSAIRILRFMARYGHPCSDRV